MGLFIGRIFGGSLVRDVFAHWLEMCLLIGWRCDGSWIGDVFALWLNMFTK